MPSMIPDGSPLRKGQGPNRAQSAGADAKVQVTAGDVRHKPGLEPTQLPRRVLLVEPSSQ